MSLWSPYVPDEKSPWNLARVVHLHRRAAFGAAWNEIERDLADGPQAAVTRVLHGEPRSEGSPPDFEQLAAVIGQAAADSGSIDRLKAWWVYRCLFSPHPLEERLTLLWHNHFATSIVKVNDVRSMFRQNETLRRHARGTFHDLLSAMLGDPALLEWLDAPDNRKGHANENLGRELLELFTLGIGHYAEADVRDAARALTGLIVEADSVREKPQFHDDGTKTILGKTGPFHPRDVVELVIGQQATSRRLAWRLCGEFFGENAVDVAAVNELADGLRSHQLRIDWGVETILRSQLFFSDANIHSRVSDPAAFLLGPLRALECWRDPPSTLALADRLRRMGQDLFAPPNVGGWPGGRTWLSTQTVIARTNTIADFLAGRLHSPARSWDPASLIERYHVGGDLAGAVRFLGNLLSGGIDRETIDATIREAKSEPDRSSQVRKAVFVLLTRPQAHLN